MTDHDVRDLLHRAAALAPTELDRPPVPDVVRQRRRTRWAAGAAAAAVLALAVPAVVQELPGRGPERLAQDAPPSSEAAATTAVTVAVSASDLAPLQVSTGPVTTGDQSWRTHELMLTNTGPDIVFVDDLHFSQLLPGEQLLAGLGCGYGIVEGRATGGCFASFHPRELAPGRSAPLTVELWRDLPGMSPLVDGTQQVSFVVRHRTSAPFQRPDGGEATDATVTLGYDIRDAAASGPPAGDDPSGPVDAERYLGVWRGPDGAPAEAGAGQQRTFELASRRMSDHCEWESAVVLQVPWPLGSTYAIGPDAVPIRHYTRDVEGVVSDVPGAFRSELDLDATLPDGARPTGYAVHDVELWFGPDGGEQFAYLVRPEGVERWPREFEPVLCA